MAEKVNSSGLSCPISGFCHVKASVGDWWIIVTANITRRIKIEIGTGKAPTSQGPTI